MSDITMCNGEKCDKKDKCYRHTAPINGYWQSMFSCSPAIKNEECQYFWNNDDKQTGKQVSTPHKL